MQRLPELRPIVALAALDFHILANQLPLASIEEAFDGSTLSFQPQAALALLID